MKLSKQICFGFFIHSFIFSYSQRLIITGDSKLFQPGTRVSINVVKPSNSMFSYPEENFDTIVNDKNCFVINTDIKTANLYRINITKGDGRKYSTMAFLEPKKCQLGIQDSFLKKIKVVGSKTFFEFEKFSNEVYNDPTTSAFRDSLDLAISNHRAQDPVVRSRLDSLLDLRTKAWSKISLKWINENGNSRINSYVAYMNLLDKGYEKDLKEIFHDLKWTPKNCWDKELVYYLSNLTVGGIAPTLNLLDTNSKATSLANFKGKYILLDFWASWCAPCRKNSAFLNTLYDRFKSKPFEIIGVSLDEKKDAWINAIKADNMKWIQVSDLKGWEKSTAAKQYFIKALPGNYLIDPGGKIIAKNIPSDKLLMTLTTLFK